MKLLQTRYLFIAVMIFMLSSCASTNESVEATQPTPVVTKDPQTELENLAASLNAVDFSRISSGNCGSFSLIVQSDRITFHEWLNNVWVDRSELLGPDSDVEPFLVTTNDYTGDGVFEFLVSYNKDAEAGGYEFGAIFMQIACSWQWAKLRGYDEVTEVMDLLAFEKETNSLVAFDYGPGGRANVVLNFNPQTNEFETMTLSADDVGVYE